MTPHVRAFQRIIALRIINGTTKIKSIGSKYFLRIAYILMMSTKYLPSFYVIISTLLLSNLSYTYLTNIVRLLDFRGRELAYQRKLMERAENVSEWGEAARKYEEQRKKFYGSKRGIKGMPAYDKDLLKKTICDVTDVNDLMHHTRFNLSRNIANIAKSKLHNVFVFVPDTIARYISHTKERLETIATCEEISKTTRIEFFREVRHSFGRTALLLSGGASFGTFHMGVVKALFEQGLLPRIIAGSSVGSIVAAIVAIRTNEELADSFTHLEDFDFQFFKDHKTIDLLRNFLMKGHIHDDLHLVSELRNVLRDYTFKEAYHRTGRILNVSICPANTNEPPHLLNYMTAPNVLIWSAVAASAAFPGLFPSQHIYLKRNDGTIDNISLTGGITTRKWLDGSIENDLPTNMLTEMFNCNYFIVSQCNPQIIPLLNFKQLVGDRFGGIVENEITHIFTQLKAILPSWAPTKWINLFTQKCEGDVTMSLPMVFSNYKKIVSNPTLPDIVHAVKLGEKSTWGKLWVIESSCAIERYLDDKLRELCGGEASWGATDEALTVQTVYSNNNNNDMYLDCCNMDLESIPSFTCTNSDTVNLDYIDP
jgi:TAG lipase / steryl ester hydrolase / phospholipase A2 / LPA acyltransferase